MEEIKLLEPHKTWTEIQIIKLNKMSKSLKK